MLISYDSTNALRRVAAKRKITFPMLSDPGSKTIEAFGILNREATGRAKGVPHPGFFILDSEGIIRKKLFFESYKKRHESADVIRALQEVR